MKEIIRVAGLGVVCGVAYGVGWWLWENILEDKLDHAYDKYQVKKLKRYI